MLVCGCAGGLVPELAAGSVVVAEAVLGGAETMYPEFMVNFEVIHMAIRYRHGI